MLCRSIAIEGFNKIKSLITDAEMAEIRIEKSGLNVSEIKQLFSSHNNLIATCRDEGITETERINLLKSAIDGGAKWIDIEVESNQKYSTELVNYAKAENCKIIISYHNYNSTPNRDELTDIANSCIKIGADLVKIATMINNNSDIANLLHLYSQKTPILALGMGELGKITRIAALKMGAPFTFVSCDNESETAPGQITESNMRGILGYLSI